MGVCVLVLHVGVCVLVLHVGVGVGVQYTVEPLNADTFWTINVLIIKMSFFQGFELSSTLFGT